MGAFDGLKGTMVSELSTGDHLKIAIVGAQKSGKSWFAAKSPPPVRIYDFDDRKASLEILPAEIKAGIGVLTLKDVTQQSPLAMKQLEEELSMLKYRKKQGNPIPATYVFDTVTYMKVAMENELMVQMGNTYYRDIKMTNNTKVRVPQGWDVINGVLRYIAYLIAEYSELGNIIFVFHERNEKDKVESTDKITKYKDNYTVDPQYLATTLSLFNEVFRIKWSNGKYEVSCKQTREFSAATTLLIDDTEPPSITDMLIKHKAMQAKIQTSVVKTA